MKRTPILAAVVAALSFAIAPPSHTSAAQIITNGGFESGQTGWIGTRHGATHNLVTTTDFHTGTHSAALCGLNSCLDEEAQNLSIPASVAQATLTYWVHVLTPGATSPDRGDSLTVDFKQARISTGFSPTVMYGGPGSGWVQQTVDVTTLFQRYEAQPLQLRMIARTDTTRPTTFFVDDVQIQVVPQSTPPPPTTTQISSDPFSASITGQHSTEVEPDSFTYGNSVVTAFQVGRTATGGSAAIGWATLNNGAWSHGLLPGITTSQSPAGPYDRATDAAVVYDAAHHLWLANSLGLSVNAQSGNVQGVAVLVNRSSDGLTWNMPVTVSSTSSGDYDKNWITCDNTATSPYYGHCYVEWDNYGATDAVLMSTSTDGGATWSAPVAPAGGPIGIGGQPLVQPNGTVIVPFADAYERSIRVITSTNGGASWTAQLLVSGVSFHTVAGGIRSSPLPTAGMDASGKVYVVWTDCRFETSCASNDLVMSTSVTGATWSAVARIPTNPQYSGQDNFVAGLAVNPQTSSSTTQLALTYYYYPNAACSAATCQLDVGFLSSIDGGTTWSTAQTLAGPMSLNWLAQTSQGVMVGDYISTSFLGNTAYPVFVAAAAPTPSSGLSEWIATTAILVTGGHARALPTAPTSAVTHDPSGVIADARTRKHAA